jgi:hypothetical protein
MGPRQLGKTTLARPFLSPEPPDYLDLEDPVVLQRLAESMAALSPLRGLVVIDQVQRRAQLFPYYEYSSTGKRGLRASGFLGARRQRRSSSPANLWPEGWRS